MKTPELLENLLTCNEIYRLYRDILNTYVSDFYVEKHWERLPNSWKNYFEKFNTEDISAFLKCDTAKSIAPLSIICLQKLLSAHGLPRQPLKPNETLMLDPIFEKVFWKGVKLKKRHEISIMANICYKHALKTNCFNIVDIGSGLGHLSRMLSFGYGFKVCTFEADKTLSNSAKPLDQKFEDTLTHMKIKHRKIYSTVHVNKRIEENLTPNEFLNLVSKSLDICQNQLKIGIVGLHPCGNLAVTLLRLFKQCPNVVFINIASCCYMKLTIEPNMYQGFPLSQFCRSNNFTLDYLSCELACHALEAYLDRLDTNDICHLKVHALRAALESIFTKADPNLSHCQIANTKYEKGSTFFDYCAKATRNMKNFQVNVTDIEYLEKLIDKTWINVVKFYSIRLAMASLIESIILYDRLLFLKESGIDDSDLIPVFDCLISPRNYVLHASQ